MASTGTNRVRERIDGGEAAIGAETKTRSPEVLELFGELGFDFVWLDLEHAGPSPYDGPRLESYQRAAEATGTTVLARLPSADPHVIRKVLDCGIRTLLIPRIETADEVRAAVRATKFSYQDGPGDRGVGTARGSRWGRALAGHADREDDATLLGVMIENESAVENIEEILSVPDLGFVFIGPADLSVSLGVPLQPDAPVVQDHIDRIVTASRDAGVPFGRIANDRARIEAAIADGCTVLRVGNDLEAIRATFSELLEGLR